MGDLPIQQPTRIDIKKTPSEDSNAFCFGMLSKLKNICCCGVKNEKASVTIGHVNPTEEKVEDEFFEVDLS